MKSGLEARNQTILIKYRLSHHPRNPRKRSPTASGWSCESHGRIRWILAHPRLFVRRVFDMTITAAA
jgi:hypothetical protein